MHQQLFSTFSRLVPVTRERKMYTADNLVADVGGYLGLLLGASALALFDHLLDMVKALAKRFRK